MPLANAGAASKLTVSAPNKLIADLALYQATDPDCGIRKAHFYPLGGLRRSAKWAYAVADGHFTLTGKGLAVDYEID